MAAVLGWITGVFVYSVVLVGTAYAQHAEVDPADDHLSRGIELRKSGDDQGALIEFEKAYKLKRSARAAGQLGTAEQALGRWDRAELHVTEALRSLHDPWVQKNRRALEEALAIIKNHIGTVAISGEPEGADVHVNGALIGQLPLAEPVRVIAGEVDIDVRAKGHQRSIVKTKINPYEFKPVIVRLEKSAANGELVAAPERSAREVRRVAPQQVHPSTRPVTAARPTMRQSGHPSEQLRRPMLSVNASASSPAPDPAAPFWKRRWVGWAVAGFGIGTSALGLPLALLGQSQIDEAVEKAKQANTTRDMALYTRAAEDFHDGESLRSAGRIMLVAGTVVTVSGIALIVAAMYRSDVMLAGIQPWFGAEAGGMASGLTWSGRW